jgi:hypothetical protein
MPNHDFGRCDVLHKATPTRPHGPPELVTNHSQQDKLPSGSSARSTGDARGVGRAASTHTNLVSQTVSIAALGNEGATIVRDSSPLEGSEAAAADGAAGAVNGGSGKAENRQPAVRARSRQRARITNGSKLLPTVSGTSVWARILKDTLDAMIIHLGGEDHVTEPQRMACRRVAVLETEMVHLEDNIGRLRCEGSAPPPRCSTSTPGSATHSGGSVRHWAGSACRGTSHLTCARISPAQNRLARPTDPVSRGL